MKKFLWLIVCLMTMVFTSCGTKYIATANYDVCYPDGTRTYDGATIVRSQTEPTVVCYSYGGTNYVSVIKTDLEFSKTYGSNGMTFISGDLVKKAENIASSTAPMRLNSYKVINPKEEKKKVKYLNDKKHKGGDEVYMSDILSH